MPEQVWDSTLLLDHRHNQFPSNRLHHGSRAHPMVNDRDHILRDDGDNDRDHGRGGDGDDGGGDDDDEQHPAGPPTSSLPFYPCGPSFLPSPKVFFSLPIVSALADP